MRAPPPNVNLERTEGRCERRPKCGCDSQADESHHAWLVIGKFAPCSPDENEAATNEDECSEDGWNKFRAGERGCRVPQPVLNIG